MLFGDRFGAAARGAGASRAARRALLALVGAGAIIACAPSAASAATPKWRTLSQSKASTTSLSPAGLVCSSSNRCVTALERKSGKHYATVVKTRTGKHTSTRTVPGLIANALTCRGRFCAAAGSVAASSNTADAAVSLTLGGHWSSLARTPSGLTASADGEAVAFWTGIACATSSDCLAVGADLAINEASSCPGGEEVTEGLCMTISPLASHYSGGNWQVITTTPVPNTSIAGADVGMLVGVACLSTHDCEVVGEYGAGAGELFAERWDGAGLTATALPSPRWSNDTNVDGVSCDRRGNCLAVGSVQKGSRVRPLAERLRAGSWRVVSTALPRGARDAALTYVSCAPGGTCMAVGSRDRKANGATQSLAQLWNGHRLRTVAVPSVRYAGSKGSAELDYVSCTGSKFCEAAGDYSKSSSALALTDDGGLSGSFFDTGGSTKGGWFTDVYSKTA